MSLSSPNEAPQKIVFLDRDGVINQDSPAYIKRPSEFVFLPKSRSAIAHLTRSGFHVYVVTNQSAINRKMLSTATLKRIHAKMTQGVEKAGGRIRDVFYCPHLPSETCRCRKPKIGMLSAAQKRYRFDLASACMVGDRAKDIECGVRAACRYRILLKTGDYEAELVQLSQNRLVPDFVAGDLYQAAEWILDQHAR